MFQLLPDVRRIESYDVGTIGGKTLSCFCGGCIWFLGLPLCRSYEWRRWQSRKMTNIEKHDLAAVDAPATWMRFRVSLIWDSASSLLTLLVSCTDGGKVVMALGSCERDDGAMMEVQRCEHNFLQDANSNSIAIEFPLAGTGKKQASMVVQRPWNFNENEGNNALAKRLADFDGGLGLLDVVRRWLALAGVREALKN
ncbi:hypothetical protein V8G54_017891 [Vigna mungo]|uniref:Uncharacterized protein n=1 Tax=Vigna mungo TaxID=3915 RepID=A0AAQ3N6W8_VIGMU